MSTDIRPTDVLVIGGGLNGCAIAYYLTREGITDVLLVEADEFGAGATGGSMGNVRQQFVHAPGDRMLTPGAGVLEVR